MDTPEVKNRREGGGRENLPIEQEIIALEIKQINPLFIILNIFYACETTRLKQTKGEAHYLMKGWILKVMSHTFPHN